MILIMNAADDVSCYAPNDAQNQFSQRIFSISSHPVHLSGGQFSAPVSGRYRDWHMLFQSNH